MAPDRLFINIRVNPRPDLGPMKDWLEPEAWKEEERKKLPCKDLQSHTYWTDKGSKCPTCFAIARGDIPEPKD